MASGTFSFTRLRQIKGPLAPSGMDGAVTLRDVDPELAGRVWAGLAAGVFLRGLRIATPCASAGQGRARGARTQRAAGGDCGSGGGGSGDRCASGQDEEPGGDPSRRPEAGGPSVTMANPFLKQVFNKDKTFRPKRKFEPGTQRFELHKRAQASLNAGLDLKLAVQLPPGEDLHDWVAVHVVDFFNRINLIYGTISDGCTERSCPIMSGGPKYEYRWQDEHKFRKPTALSAPQYMDQLMDWIELQINNEDVFPTSVGTPFPKNFLQVVKKILSRLFRVFVHVYIHHFDRLAQMGSEAHVNTCYKHFYYFVKEFGLIDTKELEPLKEMTARMCH